MLHIKFKISEHSGSEEEDFEYYLCIYLGPTGGAGPSWTKETLFEQTWQRITKLAMLHTKFQASEQSGSEEEDFLIFFYVFLWFQTRTPVAGTSWTLRP